MLHNYFAAALRNLLRDRLHAGLSIVGLAIGFAAAIVAGLYARSELTYEHSIPGYQQIYRISAGSSTPTSGFSPTDVSLPDLAPWIALHLPALKPIARLHIGTDAGVRVAGSEATEHIYWADPGFFDVFRLPLRAGTLDRALERPDSLVITSSAARRLFGRDDVVGKTVELDRKYTLRINGVIDDLPSNTHLDFNLVASATARFSPLAQLDRQPPGAAKGWDVYTYFRLPPSMSLDGIQAALRAFILEAWERPGRHKEMRLFLPVMPIAAIHLSEPGAGALKSAGSLERIYAICAVSALILIVSIINFVNLSTARSTRRSIEIAVRKAAGATRLQLMTQFIGEALLHAALAAVLALCLLELLLPHFNRLADSALSFDYRHQAGLLISIAALTLACGALAGAYPAFVLSSMRPVTALKGGPLRSGSTIRSLLVCAQFAVLIGLLCAIFAIYEQTTLAKDAASQLDTHNVFVIDGGCSLDDNASSTDLFGALPGVVSAACSESAPFGQTKRHKYGTVRKNIKLMYRKEVVDYGFFELYGMKPFAGRLFSRAHADENSVIINSTAARRFGFPSAAAAVGQYVTVLDDSHPSEVVGVIPDFPLESVRSPIEPTVFSIDRPSLALLSLRVTGANQERTLESIRGLWKQRYPFRPIVLFPVDQGLRELYAELIADGAIFSACSSIALLLSCIGIFGLASFTVERRTKETGIRKAMGADRIDVLRLLIGQLSRPVLIANVVAWPVCYFALRHWLEGFAYHVDLGPGVFLGGTVTAMLIAWITVFSQALRLANLKPVKSLRYE